MKRTVIILTLATMTAVGNAQFFVEGSIGAGYNSGRSLFWIYKPSNIYLNVAPLTGYQLNDRISAGIKASIARAKETVMRIDPDTGNEVELVRREPGWSFAVFCRYQLLRTKKLSFLVETSAYVSGNKSIDESAASFLYHQTVSSKGINMQPLVTYDLSDRFSFIASCDFLSLNLSTQTETYKDGFKAKRNHFGFTGQSEVFRHLHSVRIGFIYHFKKSSK